MALKIFEIQKFIFVSNLCWLWLKLVIVTHDIGEAGFLDDIIVLLRDGQIVQQGSLPEFVHTPADPFVTQFINAQRNPLEALNIS